MLFSNGTFKKEYCIKIEFFTYERIIFTAKRQLFQSLKGEKIVAYKTKKFYDRVRCHFTDIQGENFFM